MKISEALMFLLAVLLVLVVYVAAKAAVSVYPEGSYGVYNAKGELVWVCVTQAEAAGYEVEVQEGSVAIIGGTACDKLGRRSWRQLR